MAIPHGKQSKPQLVGLIDAVRSKAVFHVDHVQPLALPVFDDHVWRVDDAGYFTALNLGQRPQLKSGVNLVRQTAVPDKVSVELVLFGTIERVAIGEKLVAALIQGCWRTLVHFG